MPVIWSNYDTTMIIAIKKDGGRLGDVPAEIFLKIIENAVDVDPRSFIILMLVSKDIQYLVKRYESSIVRHTTPSHDNSILLRSCVLPEHVRVPPSSYMWLIELRSRGAMVDILMKNKYTDMSQWFTEKTPDDTARINKFKRSSFALLYQLSDATAGLKHATSCRAEQCDMLTTLDQAELAKLGIILTALGNSYGKMSGISPNCVGEHALEHQRILRESTCAFEDKTIRYGPFFAICALLSPPVHKSSFSYLKTQWAERMINQGLSDLRQYEAGGDFHYASLQSTIWRFFCQKVGCGLDISWPTALGLIKFEMDGYKL